MSGRLRRLLPQQPGKVGLLFLFFFAVIALFWTLKPLRTSSVVKSLGVAYYPLVKQGVLLLIPLVLAIYNYLAARVSRAVLVYLFVAFFVVANLVFWALFRYSPANWVRVVFFFYVDTYITIMVVLFWTYLNDVYTTQGARQVYGLVGAGGLAGGIVGSLLAGWFTKTLGSDIILVAAFMPLLIAVAVGVLERVYVAPSEPVEEREPEGERRREGLVTSLVEGLRTVSRSRYLWSVVALVGLYEISSTLIDYQFNESCADAFATRDAMAAFQGKVFFGAQVAALVVQVLLTTLVHRKLGPIWGLLFLPVVLLSGSIVFMVVPTLVVITGTIAGEAAFGYSINQASKEILYVPLDRDAKYRGKAFIDMFVYRGGKTVGAVILMLYAFWWQPAGVGSWFLMMLVVGCAAGWFLAIHRIRARFSRRELAEAKRRVGSGQ